MNDRNTHVYTWLREEALCDFEKYTCALRKRPNRSSKAELFVFEIWSSHWQYSLHLRIRVYHSLFWPYDIIWSSFYIIQHFPTKIDMHAWTMVMLTYMREASGGTSLTNINSKSWKQKHMKGTLDPWINFITFKW